MRVVCGSGMGVTRAEGCRQGSRVARCVIGCLMSQGRISRRTRARDRIWRDACNLINISSDTRLRQPAGERGCRLKLAKTKLPPRARGRRSAEIGKGRNFASVRSFRKGGWTWFSDIIWSAFLNAAGAAASDYFRKNRSRGCRPRRASFT